MTRQTEAKLRRDARAIFDQALRAADPREAILRMERKLAPVLRRRYANVYVIGAGKASAVMAQAVEKLLGPGRITAGLINVKDGHTAKLRAIELVECGHPVPDERGVEGARRMAAMAAGAGADDLVICLISGGASALLPLPVAGITLGEKQDVTRRLLECGANIHEMNTVRKHLSRIKGGQLARMAAPARLLTIGLSDVVGDDRSVIGSGPTWPDASTFADAREVLQRYSLPSRVPASVWRHLVAAEEETPKAEDAAFAGSVYEMAGSNRIAVEAARREARARGYRTLVLGTRIEGETRDIARMHAAIAREWEGRRPACILSGGETTVTLRGAGKGGRNTEFALAAALDLDAEGIVVLSGGTDGTDGPTDAAGGVTSGRTMERARALGMNPRAVLEANDSYTLLEATGDLLKTGPTGTNVMDVRVLLVV